MAVSTISLPRPCYDGTVALERVLRERRTVREFGGAPLMLAELSQLLWAAQGITSGEGLRTAPSAGALYPLEVYVVGGDIAGLESGAYRYEPKPHRLIAVTLEDVRPQIADAARGQAWVEENGALFVVSAVEGRITGKYGPRGVQFMYIEAGHAAQNVLLQAAALGLGAGVVGAFEEGQVGRILRMDEGERPLYLVAVGRT